MNELAKLIEQIENVQGAEWNGTCERTECYWNMWTPKNDKDTTCVSESLSVVKMEPNTENCPSYWSYETACGCKKGEIE